MISVKEKEIFAMVFMVKESNKIFFPDILTCGRIIVDDCVCGIFTYDT